jgi:hypothetical protein
MGPVTVTVKRERQKSKFSKPNQPKPDYVVLVINQDEFGYNVENEKCAEFFRGRAGSTMTIIAEGRAEEATITHVGAPASQMQQPPPAQQPPAQRPPPASAQPHHPAASEQDGDMVKNAKHFIARNRVLTVMALEAMWHTKREFETAKQFELPDTMLPVIFNSMLFGASANGITAANVGLPLDLKFKSETTQ